MRISDLFGNKKVPSPSPGSRAFNPYSAGNKHYGAGRPMPNIGPVANPQGYNERDNKAKARKRAIMRRMKGASTGNPMNKKVMDYTTREALK